MEWIPVNEKVPAIDQKFDAWINGQRHTDCGAYIGRGWTEESIRENMILKGITYWLPLPVRSPGDPTKTVPMDQPAQEAKEICISPTCGDHTDHLRGEGRCEARF